MASENKEKKRKSITLSSDGPQKPHKKSKKSIKNKKDSAVSVETANAVATNGPETITKSKHQPRKRAADFLSDTEDNAANAASAPAPSKRDAETTEKHKGKKSKKVADISKADSSTPIVRPAFNKDAKVEISKKSKKAAPLPKDHVVSPSDALPMTSFEEQQDPAKSGMVTEKVENTLDTPMPPHSKKSKKHKTAKGQASAIAETLTAHSINSVAEKIDDGSLDPQTNKDATSISMQVEGQMTAEKEIEDEWGSDDEEDDQGVELLKGFDTDGEDNAEDVGLEASKPLPKLSNKASKKAKQAAQKGGSEVPGTVYVGRIPHGFYEHQMREYFSQFGSITKLRLSRNKMTGASKHFAFIEFESDEVAKIVANAMDNYLMFGHILKCKYAPQESLHPDLWKGANKRFRKVPYTMLEKRALEAPKTSKQWEKRNEREQKKREQKAEKMKVLGYEMKLPILKEPQEVLVQRKLQNAEQQKLLKAAEEAQDVLAGAMEPLNSLPMDEVALKMEGKSKKKKNKPAQQQSMKSVAEMPTAHQPANATAEKSHPETEKRDKRKEKKTKSKDAKAEQTQLDAQLLGDIEATADEPDTSLKPPKSTTIEAEPVPEKEEKDETTAVNPLTNNNEKRKRRKSKVVKAGEIAMPVAIQAANAEASADKPKKKNRKSANDVEPKGMLKKSSEAA